MAVSTIDPAGLNIGQIGGRRNLVINGAMQVAQRGTSSASEGYQTVDRFRFTSSDMDQLAFTQSQDTTGPSGFTNSYKLTVTTPETTTEAEEQLFMYHCIEAQNLQQLGYGTSDAKQLTLSFWVKSSVTGAYCVAFYENDGNRLITSTYSISSANTWEYKTITIDGDTSGTINNDNGSGLELYFFLSVGPDRKTTDSTTWGTWTAAKFGYGQVADVAATSSATWQITGVQLEVSPSGEPTPFEHRSYGEELSACQRYYHQTSLYGQTLANGILHTEILFHSYAKGAATWEFLTTTFPTTMRTAPAITLSDKQGNIGKMTTYTSTGGASAADATPYSIYSSIDGVRVTEYTAGSIYGFGYEYKADAEL